MSQRNSGYERAPKKRSLVAEFSEPAFRANSTIAEVE
jgi:hypothetical protein